MEPTQQFFITLFTGLLISAFTSIITVRLALKRFYSERWWERKADTYSMIVESLYHVKHNMEVLYDAAIVGEEVSEVKRDKLQELASKGNEEISKAAGIGAFIISEEAAKSLAHLKYNLALKEEDTSWVEFLDIKLALISKGMDQLRELAKKDLSIR